METSVNTALDPSAVQAKAYELWEAWGRPEGAAERTWLEAERLLRLDSRNAAADVNAEADGTDAVSGTFASEPQRTDKSEAAPRRASKSEPAPREVSVAAPEPGRAKEAEPEPRKATPSETAIASSTASCAPERDSSKVKKSSGSRRTRH